jgi:hypothetical protein
VTGYSYVLDDEDRIVDVRPRASHSLGPFVGQVLWGRLPGAEPLLRPRFDEARSTGEELAFTVYYAGSTDSIRVVPHGRRLDVHVERLTELDVTSLGTLAESLRRIEAELAARESAPHDRPAPASLRALP